MSCVPRKAPEPEHRAPTVRTPVGATLFLVAVATIYPGLFFLLGTLAYVCVHLVALGPPPAFCPSASPSSSSQRSPGASPEG